MNVCNVQLFSSDNSTAKKRRVEETFLLKVNCSVQIGRNKIQLCFTCKPVELVRFAKLIELKLDSNLVHFLIRIQSKFKLNLV